MQSKSVQILMQEYKRRRDKNAKYSLRAFARYLQIPPGRLSEYISGKRQLTPKVAGHLSNRLMMSSEEFGETLSVVRRSRGFENHKLLADDQFHLIAEPHHLAILSLIETRDFKYEISWIAKRLSLSHIEVRDAVERLRRSGLIVVEKDSIRLNQIGVKTSQDVPSGAIRKFHHKSIESAQKSLDVVAVELRDFTSIVMAADIHQLAKAKSEIKKFRAKLSRILETKPNQNEVYQLNIQLFPLTQTAGDKK